MTRSALSMGDAYIKILTQKHLQNSSAAGEPPKYLPIKVLYMFAETVLMSTRIIKSFAMKGRISF